MNDAPEMPEPEKAPPEAKGDQKVPPKAEGQPSQNGNGEYLDSQKLIEWIKATDKEIKYLRIGQIVLCGAVLVLIFANTKAKAPTP